MAYGTTAATSPMLAGGNVTLDPSKYLTWGDAVLLRIAANVVGLKNAAAAQEFRVYGNATVYGALSHDGTNGLTVGVSSALNLYLKTNAVTRWQILSTTNGFAPGADNTYPLGDPTKRLSNLHAMIITNYDATALITTGVALPNGAGVSSALLGNAPNAGNPSKWIPINDAGTIRYIPTWA